MDIKINTHNHSLEERVAFGVSARVTVAELIVFICFARCKG